MNNITSITKLLGIWLPLLIIAIVLGCARSNAAPTTDQGTQMSPMRVTGYSEGNKIPAFSMHLVDGSTVTSEQLINEGRPTFLFFAKYT